MKFLYFLPTLLFFSLNAQVKMPALQRDTLVKQIELTVNAVQNSPFDFQGEKLRDGVFETYMFNFYGFRDGTFYSGDNDTQIEVSFGTDEIGQFLNANLQEAVTAFANKNGYTMNTEKVKLKSLKKKYSVLHVVDPKKNFPVLDLNIFDSGKSLTFYSGAIDPNVARYYGVVTCLTYQSSNASNSEYSGVEYIYIYAKGNPNFSPQQIIQYAESNTPAQISRRSWQWLGKVDSKTLEKQKKLQRDYGKVVFEQSLTMQ
jgi:hypothetical protein